VAEDDLPDTERPEPAELILAAFKRRLCELMGTGPMVRSLPWGWQEADTKAGSMTVRPSPSRVRYEADAALWLQSGCGNRDFGVAAIGAAIR
jgi:hypothetical protein